MVLAVSSGTNEKNGGYFSTRREIISEKLRKYLFFREIIIK